MKLGAPISIHLTGMGGMKYAKLCMINERVWFMRFTS